MIRFLIKCLLFGCPVLAGFIAVAYMADGYTDRYYLRLTSPAQSALIVGSSRAARGIRPDVLNTALAQEYPRPVYNFSFTYGHSPFGPTYLTAIGRKLDSPARNGYFIVSVDPWELSASKTSPEDSTAFVENKLMLANNTRINGYPCFSYLINDYPNPYLTLLTGKIHRSIFHYRPEFFLHDDGWLEMSGPLDSVSVARRRYSILDQYANLIAAETISHTRLSYLRKTIAFLHRYGDVYVVRLPVHPDVQAQEDSYCPRLSIIIDSIAHGMGVPYFDFTASGERYTYTDGSHLSKESAAVLSRQLASLIIQHRHTR